MEKRFFEKDVKNRLFLLQQKFPHIITKTGSCNLTAINQSRAEIELIGNYIDPEKCVKVINLSITERSLMIATQKWFLKFTKLLKKRQ